MMEQRSKEWFEARQGKLSASSMADAMSYTAKGASTAKRIDLLKRLAWERINKVSFEIFVNNAMKWGVEYEDEARLEYEAATGNFVMETGFLDHPKLPMLGASPDGLIGNDGLVELKCPTQATHADYIIEGVVPEQYKAQMTLQLMCTGRVWCDFVSYDPRNIPQFRLFIRRFIPDKEYVKLVTDEAIKFNKECNELVDKILASTPIEVGK
jgi:putative phage-type endonuclease